MELIVPVSGFPCNTQHAMLPRVLQFPYTCATVIYEHMFLHLEKYASWRDGLLLLLDRYILIFSYVIRSLRLKDTIHYILM